MTINASRYAQEITDLINRKQALVFDIEDYISAKDWEKVSEMAGELRDIETKLIIYSLIQKIGGGK